MGDNSYNFDPFSDDTDEGVENNTPNSSGNSPEPNIGLEPPKTDSDKKSNSSHYEERIDPVVILEYICNLLPGYKSTPKIRSRNSKYRFRVFSRDATIKRDFHHIDILLNNKEKIIGRGVREICRALKQSRMERESL